MRRELADFLDYCRVERRLAPMTCSAYERDVGTCIAFLEREGIVTVREVGPAHLRRFLAEESMRRPAPSSQARTVAALKCFFRFLLENEEIDRDPALVLRTPKKRETLPDVLDRRELARLLDADRSATTSGSAALPGQARARPAPAGALRVRRPAPERAARARLAGRRPRAAAAAGAKGEGRPPADRPDPPRTRAALRRVPPRPAGDPEPALFVGVQGKRLSQTI